MTFAKWTALSLVGSAFIIIGSGALVLWSVGQTLCADEEIARVTSPDGRADAITMQRNCGATTDYVYQVFLVAKGGRAPKNDDESVFRADHVRDGVQVRWIADRQLRIEYVRAEVFHFRNSWVGPWDKGYDVKIIETATAD